MKIERRLISNVEVRIETQGDDLVLVGYAAKFNSLSEDLGGFREVVLPGAFKRSIDAGDDVKCLQNHDPNLVMGRTRNKTLTVQEDETGLHFRSILPKTQAARDLHTLVERGDIDQCSFAFVPQEDEWEEARDSKGESYIKRSLKDVDLLDVSAVTYPAYGETSVKARFNTEALAEVRSKLDKVKLSDIKSLQVLDRDGNPIGEILRTDTRPYPHKGTKAGESANDSETHKSAGDAHLAAAAKEKEKGNDQAAAAHTKAANAHYDAASAHDFKKEADAMSGEANKLSSTANSISAGRSVQISLRYSDGSYEAMIGEINEELCETYGKSSSGYGSKYWTVETYPDHVIVCNSDEGCYHSIVYTKDVNGEITFGEMTDVEQQWAPETESDDERAARSSIAALLRTSIRIEKKKAASRSRAEDVSDPSSPDYDPDDPDYDPELDDSPDDDERGKYRTVNGERLRADQFAYVPDVQDPSSWRLPLSTEALTKRSLERFNQTKMLKWTDSEKEAQSRTWRQLLKACSEFKIAVTDDDSLRCGFKPEETKASLNDLNIDPVREALEMRLRLIEIDLN